VTNEIVRADPVDNSNVATSDQHVHLRVTIPRSDDVEGVIRLLGEVNELLKSYSGEDRYSLYVENGGRGRIQISFPNDTTGHCLELEQKLRSLVRGGTVRVDPLGQEDWDMPQG
jgi:hypothetical protein